MKILLIGGNGFIGSALCLALLRKKYGVISFDRSLPAKQLEGIKYVLGDFFNRKDLIEAIGEADCIVHAVSTINPGNSNSHIVDKYTGDFVQTVWLLEQCAHMSKRLIFLSSGGTVYGRAEVIPTPEDSPLHPINHYGSVKACIETAIGAFVSQNEADFLIARIANPFGPGQDYRKGVGFIDAVVRRAIADEVLEVWGDGKVVRDYVYIEDVANALAALIEYKGNYKAFNIGTGIGSTQKQIIGMVRSIGLNIKVKYLPERSVDLPISVLDNSRILPLLPNGFRSVDQGIKQYSEWLQGHVQGKGTRYNE